MEFEYRIKKFSDDIQCQKFKIVETGKVLEINSYETDKVKDIQSIIMDKFELDESKFLDELILKYKNHQLYLDTNQLKSLIKGGFFSKTNWSRFKKNHHFIKENQKFIMGFGNEKEGVLFTKSERIIDGRKYYNHNRYSMYENGGIDNGFVIGYSGPISNGRWNEEGKFRVNEIITSKFKSNDIKSFISEQFLLVMKQYRVWEDRVLETLNEKEKNLSQNKSSVLSELDKDGNGEVDVVEGNDFNLLLKKHQKSIVEVDRNYVQQFVKVSSYIKTKKGNIQSIFNFIKDIPNQELLNEYIEILKDDIHTYNLVLFNSLNMIVSLVEDDMITFYEIHEMFDNLNMFDSKHEKDVSQKLTNIGDGLKDLMYEIRDVGDKISNSIQELIYVTEESNRLLSSQLSEIDSTMKVGNLINTINTYQNYKTNRRLNS